MEVFVHFQTQRSKLTFTRGFPRAAFCFLRFQTIHIPAPSTAASSSRCRSQAKRRVTWQLSKRHGACPPWWFLGQKPLENKKLGIMVIMVIPPWWFSLVIFWWFLLGDFFVIWPGDSHWSPNNHSTTRLLFTFVRWIRKNFTHQRAALYGFNIRYVPSEIFPHIQSFSMVIPRMCLFMFIHQNSKEIGDVIIIRGMWFHVCVYYCSFTKRKADSLEKNKWIKTSDILSIFCWLEIGGIFSNWNWTPYSLNSGNDWIIGGFTIKIYDSNGSNGDSIQYHHHIYIYWYYNIYW